MKIGMLVYNFWPGPQGGTEKQCRKLSVELARRAHNIWVITSWPGLGVSRRERYEGFEIVRCGLFRPVLNGIRFVRDRAQKILAAKPENAKRECANARTRKKIRFMAPFQWLDKLFFILESMSRIRKLDIQVLHVHESHWIAGLAAWLGRRLNIPVVCKEATFPAFPPFEPDVPWARLWQRERLRCQRYVALTPQMADDLKQRGIEAERVVVIPNGVDLPPPVSWAARDAQMVLCVANLAQGVQNKGIHVLIESWRKVAERWPEARLVVVGRYDSVHLSQAIGAKRPPRLDLVGFVEDPSPYYRRASLFVLPSKIEGLSNALLEAQSWGVPAVVTDIPASTAVVADGVNGRVVPVEDPDALAASISDLLADPQAMEHMGRAAREVVEQRFAVPKIADRWIDLYAEVVLQR